MDIWCHEDASGKTRYSTSIPLAGAAIAVSSWFPATTQSSNSASHDTNNYQHEFFSLTIPPECTANTIISSPENTAIVFSQDEPPHAFQVAITAVTAPLPTTIEDFQTAVPGVEVSEFQTSTVGGEPAISFYSFDDAVGDTFEMWLAHDGRLYQVMTSADISTWMTQTLLKSWIFVSTGRLLVSEGH